MSGGESVDRLRQAAAQMRRDWPVGEFCPDRCNCNQDGADYHPEADVFQRVADWLDMQADLHASLVEDGHMKDYDGAAGDREARAVADAFLGAAL